MWPIISLALTVNLAPYADRASKCVPTARLPMVSPPGNPRLTWPNLANRGAKNIIEERTLRLRLAGMGVGLALVGSIVSVEVPTPDTFAPIASKISQATETSDITGTLERITGPEAIIVAGKSDKMEFLLPEI